MTYDAQYVNDVNTLRCVVGAAYKKLAFSVGHVVVGTRRRWIHCGNALATAHTHLHIPHMTTMPPTFPLSAYRIVVTFRKWEIVSALCRQRLHRHPRHNAHSCSNFYYIFDCGAKRHSKDRTNMFKFNVVRGDEYPPIW